MFVGKSLAAIDVLTQGHFLFLAESGLARGGAITARHGQRLAKGLGWCHTLRAIVLAKGTAPPEPGGQALSPLTDNGAGPNANDRPG